ncbi:amphi-Trp domain-containing protein [Halosimplex salinum]|uniref:amphi-Trp domain-containing protein n=1 Tax=Halosimplex salinum TaxID=1710538 RepID=UPI000F47B9C3|nr:amphi-Trp domain-containing protein [Halosimplex salinum]
MPEKVLFEDERQLPRTDVAAYLRTIAERLETGDSLTLESGSDSFTVEVPNDVEFEVKVEREGPADGDGELGLELELEWDENADDGSLSIQ